MDNYSEIKKKIAQGWNTWNTRSVLSHVLLPECFAVNLGIKDNMTGHYLKEALIGRFGEHDEKIHPGDHAYDGGYTQLNLKWEELELNIQSAACQEELVLLITPMASLPKPATLVIESGILWNRMGTLSKVGDAIIAQLPGGTVEVHTTGAPVIEYGAAAQTPYLSVSLHEPVGVSTGKRRSIDEIQGIIEENRLKHIKRKEQYGELSEAYHAMQSCLAWDTIYEPQKDRVVSPVSRLWNVEKGGYALFCWDNYFAAYMASLDYKELAYSNAIEITREKTADGFVPNCAWGNSFTSDDRSQPPVGSMVVLALYRKYRDLWLLEELFEDLYHWNTWFFRNRTTDKGFMAWGSSPYNTEQVIQTRAKVVNTAYAAKLESGLDNSPMYDDIPYDTEKHMMKLADVGLMGLYIMDCDALGAIADILKKKEEGEELKNRAGSCKKSLEALWDETTGMYLNKRTDTNEFSPRMSPANFYALFSDEVSAHQVQRVLEEHFYNPREFWGAWCMPSIARNDPAYGDQEYWRGRIWAPMNFLVYLAFRKQKLYDAQKDLARKSKELILKEWLESGHVHENYNADTGEGCDAGRSDKFYHWGGLLSMVALIEAGYMEGPEKPVSLSQ